MAGKNYPGDWSDRREKVLERSGHVCNNCNRDDPPLEVHHIVPISQGGSHQLSNLVALCPRCHKAAHGDEMAPRIRWYTNGNLSTDEFGKHLNLWKRMRDELGVPRYDPDEDAVYVPVADSDEIVARMRQ